MSLAICHSLASRFLSGRSREPLISFIGRISMTGMALAVAILVLVLSVMNGFEREFRERILALVPHATLEFMQPVSDWQSAANALEAAPGVHSTTPFVQTEGLALRGSTAEPMLLLGLPKAYYQHRFAALALPTGGTGNAADANPTAAPWPAPGEVVLGKKLAQRLGLEPGQRFRVMLNRPSAAADSGAAANASAATSPFATRAMTLTMVGVLGTGTELDNVLAVSSLSALAQQVYPDSNEPLVEGLFIDVDDLFAARQIAVDAAYSAAVPGYLSDWTRQYGNLYQAIQLSRQMVVILLAAIVAIAAFNIFVTLGMSVRHRQREIAILRTLGLRQRQIWLTFCLQGLYIFLPGFAVGAVIGIVLALLVPHAVAAIEAIFAIEFLNTDVYPIDYLPAELRLADLGVIFLIAFAISLLATVLPAWRASRMPPAEALN